MTPWIVLGIVAPWLAGMAVVYRRGCGAAGLLLTLGGGWLAGQVLLMLGLYASLRITGASHARGLVVLLLIAAGVIVVARIVAGRRSSADAKSVPHRAPAGQSAGFVVIALTILFVVSMSAKLISLVPVHRHVSIRNDDAISMWLFKAKVVAESDTLSFDKSDPFYLGGSNPRYPVFLPLSAAFLPLVDGGWSESLSAAPWMGFFLATPLMIIGALRVRLGMTTPALIAAYFVMSLPLLGVHVYRPGYADLPLAAFLAAAVAFAVLAHSDTWRGQGSVASLVMLIGAALMKREGPVLACLVGLVMLLPLVLTLVRRRSKMAGGLIAGALAAMVFVFMVVDIRDVDENVMAIAFHGEVFGSLANHAFAWGSFNLGFWLLPIAIVAAAALRGAEMRVRVLLLVVALLAIDVCIFALTPQYRFAMNDQTPSRLFLQIMPAIIVALTIPLSTGLAGCTGATAANTAAKR